MSFARRLRFRASLMKIGFDGFAGVVRDRAAAYGSTRTERKTAPPTDFDPFSAEMMHDPYPGYRALLTGPNVPNVWYNRKRGIWIVPATTTCERRCATTRRCRRRKAKLGIASICRR